MRFIKLALISLVVLFALATALSALLPSMVLVSRAVTINAPSDSVLVRVRDINNWKTWIEGMDGPGVQVHSGTSATLGETVVTITSVSDSAVVSNWDSKKASPQTSTIRLISQPGTPVTVVQWQFVEQVKWYPWAKLGSIMNDKIIGPMMEKNLANLKKGLESQ
jgi:hypothetical protein